MSKWHGDWGQAQAPVHGRDGQLVGSVVYDPYRACWRACDVRGRGTEGEHGSRAQAVREQVITAAIQVGELDTGAALVSGPLEQALCGLYAALDAL